MRWTGPARQRHEILTPDDPGLPVAVSTPAAHHHEVTLVQWSFDFYMIEATPDNVIGAAPTTVTNSMKSCAKTVPLKRF